MLTNQVIKLDDYRPLFRDDEAFREFVAAFKSIGAQGASLVLAGGEAIGSILSAGGTKELLYERVVKKIAADPNILTKLADRLERGNIVD